MASLSIPQPGKISDRQFIGDLMVLFERRKVKCGEPSSFDDFTSELASNNRLRGDLFALCTAISHMASEDLSGEELLLLVARALGGTGIAKGAAVPEIPGNMRKAFLDGYEAWGNRSALAMGEPETWPPPRKTAAALGEETSFQVNSEPAEARDPAEGTRTIQEALQIARERSPNGMLSPRLNTTSPDIEHLTISELKKLLENIEHRVNRIQPHIDPMERVAAPTSPDLVTRTEAPIPRRAVLTFDSVRTASPDEHAEAAVGENASGEFAEDAFLKRHAYLRPTTRAEQATEAIAASPNSIAPSLTEVPYTAPTAEENAIVADAPPVIASSAIAIPSRTETEPQSAPMDFLAGYPQGLVQVSARAKVAVLLAFAGLFLIAFTLGGIYVYRSLHPKTVYDYSRFKPAVPSPVSDVPEIPAAVAAPETAHAGSHAQPVRSGAKVAGKSQFSAFSQQRPAASVWPPSNQTVRDVYPQDAASGAEARRTSPVHVDAAANGASTTIVGFATKPVHVEQANGVSGTVMVEATISKQGNVTNARVISGPQELRSAALQTVQQWKFKPYTVDGAPAEVTTTLGVYVKGD